MQGPPCASRSNFRRCFTASCHRTKRFSRCRGHTIGSALYGASFRCRSFASRSHRRGPRWWRFWWWIHYHYLVIVIVGIVNFNFLVSGGWLCCFCHSIRVCCRIFFPGICSLFSSAVLLVVEEEIARLPAAATCDAAGIHTTTLSSSSSLSFLLSTLLLLLGTGEVLFLILFMFLLMFVLVVESRGMPLMLGTTEAFVGVGVVVDW